MSQVKRKLDDIVASNVALFAIVIYEKNNFKVIFRIDNFFFSNRQVLLTSLFLV